MVRQLDAGRDDAGLAEEDRDLKGYSLDPPLREPDIKRTDLAQPPVGLRDGRFQVETAHLPLQNVIFALFRGPGWLREQSTSESSVLLMVGQNCTLVIHVSCVTSGHTLIDTHVSHVLIRM